MLRIIRSNGDNIIHHWMKAKTILLACDGKVTIELNI